MTCDDCAKSHATLDELHLMLSEIKASQAESHTALKWMVDTVDGVRKSIEQMMNAGGPLAMLKMLRSNKNDN